MTASPGGDRAPTAVAERWGPPHLLVGGEYRPAAGRATYDVHDPSTGATLASVPEASATDVAQAVEAGQAAWPEWSRAGVRHRIAVLRALADAVASQLDDLALLDSVDSGNPVAAMRRDIRFALDRVQDMMGYAVSIRGETISDGTPDLHLTVGQPYGVVGRIVPFNHPLRNALVGSVGPLLMGNAVVLKPALQTPLSALALGSLARDLLPPGVLNIVTGGAETGDAIVTHPRVKRLAFTGSVATSRVIQQRAATAGVKHLTFELGGKNPMIVFPDADVEAAVAGARRGMNFESCQGQSCGSMSRVFVHEAIYREFLEAYEASLATIRLGPAYDADTQMGPLVSDTQRQQVLGFVDSGRDDGASVAFTGTVPPQAPEGGYYLPPMILTGVAPDMSVAREEIFGPVVSLFPWKDTDEVVAAANGIAYGLTASVWTNDLRRALEVAYALEAGYVWTNETGTHYGGAPFGGWKDSGVGREGHFDELRTYQELKTIHLSNLGG